jgi:hypothetical protein
MVQPWKLLAYVAADNSLYDDAQVSLREITNASRFSDVETIVQVDGPSTQLSTRYRCINGSKEVIWAAPDHYTLDRAQRLREFLMACVDESQEMKRIFLVLWGHGAGLDHVYFIGNTGSTVDTDFAPSETLNIANPNQYVENVALARILLEFTQTTGQKIDLLGFDACMMAMVEIWHEIRESTQLAVASDLKLPKSSWPYETILSDLAHCSGMDANTLAAIIVSRFLERYDAQGRHERVSLSACSLDACNPFADAMKKLVDEMKKVVLEGEARRRIFRARDSSRTPDEIAYIDMGNFARELCQSFDRKSAIHECSRNVLRVLTGYPYLIYNRNAKKDECYDAYGVALYFPMTLAPSCDHLYQSAANRNLETERRLGFWADTKFPPTIGKFLPTIGKFPPTIGKFPPTIGKFPPTIGKFPPTIGKFATAGGANGSPDHAGDDAITGYEILWSHYKELQFCRTTGWADLIETALSLGY